MSLTFRSSTPETVAIHEQQSDGRWRIAVATRDLGSARHWNLTEEHLGGQAWKGTYTGDKPNVVIALHEMMSRNEHEYLSAKARGDRPRQQPYDHNRRVVDSYAPIIPISDKR